MRELLQHISVSVRLEATHSQNVFNLMLEI